MECDGNTREICGGGLRLSVYSTGGGRSAKYLGCFKERSREARLMPDEMVEFRNSLTPTKCIQFCKEKGYDYAGLQFSFECFCSNARPSFKSSADESDCNLKCDGDQNQICGANFRLSVYETSELLANFVESNYLGCYSDNGDNRLLNGKYDTFTKRLSPEFCVGFCYRNGYRFAGVHNGTQCFCGDSLNQGQSKLRDSDCDIKCANSRFNCGGLRKNGVYHTQISDYSEDGKLIGCFIDNQELRVLSAIKMTFEDKCTPKLCLNICLQLGYKYSGVEYGSECYCGNRRPNSSLEVGENHCATPCPGNRRKNCGGGWRILVYSTNVGASVDFQIFTTSSTTTTRRPATTTRSTTTTRRQVQTQRPVVQQTTARPSYTTQRTTPRPQNNQRPNQAQTTTSTYKPLMLASTSSGGSSNKNSNNNKPKPGKSCIQSTTVVNGKTVCRGEMLFKEDFVNSLSNDKWTYEVKMPWIPDYEFVVFQKKDQNAFIKNGKLYLKPTLLEDEFVRRGRLELHRCTGMPYSEECVRQAATFSILPPIESTRITTKDAITFKYGMIQVRAKLPLGDWIVPEIWLEPKRKLYGPSYASGRIRIAMARGNKNLLAGDQDIGNRQLESGILMGVGENIRGRTIIRDKIDGWHKHFHNYTLMWTPDNLQFLVDGQHEESIMNPGATLADLVEFDENTAITWRTGTKIAPFDQEFYLSLGISVGGMRDFPDESTSAGHEKPWRNMAVKAMLNFWQDRHHWRNSWDDERSALQIEHVRIKAL
ncbi:uncharacterized protein isoform X2 [Rhodnius prolixus]